LQLVGYFPNCIKMHVFMNYNFSSCFVDILAYPQEADESDFHQARSTNANAVNKK
jgi:hypothetical protein